MPSVQKNPIKLKNHQRWHTRNCSYSNMNNSKKIECSICNTQFTFYHGLQSHVEDFHSSEILKIAFTCDLCNIKLFSKMFMRKHMSSEHSGPYGCLDRNCMKRFVNTRTRRERFKTTHSRSFDGDLKRLEIKRKDFYAFPYKCFNSISIQAVKEDSKTEYTWLIITEHIQRLVFFLFVHKLNRTFSVR